MKQRQSGFSLVEMLVVIAIIGIVSLVTVPNFIALRRSSMMKNSMRNFMADIRGSRQRGVTRNEQTKLVFTNGSSTTGRQYTLWEYNRTAAAWQQVGGPKQFEQFCYISTETDIPTPDSGTTYEIGFRPDGTAILPAGIFKGKVLMKTDANIPSNKYTVCVYYTGTIKALQGDVACP